jgi:hypothetical protein
LVGYVGQFFLEEKQKSSAKIVIEIVPEEEDESWNAGFYFIEKGPPLHFEDSLRKLCKAASGSIPKREPQNAVASGQFLASASTADMLIEYPARTIVQLHHLFPARAIAAHRDFVSRFCSIPRTFLAPKPKSTCLRPLRFVLFTG